MDIKERAGRRIETTAADFREIYEEHGPGPALRLLATAAPLLSAEQAANIGRWFKRMADEDKSFTGGDAQAGMRAAAACLSHIATLKRRGHLL
jgi:hypothetical protein